VLASLTLSSCARSTAGAETVDGLAVTVVDAGERPALDRGPEVPYAEGDPVCVINVTLQNISGADIEIESKSISSHDGEPLSLMAGIVEVRTATR
jgi:hypothetical protein